MSSGFGWTTVRLETRLRLGTLWFKEPRTLVVGKVGRRMADMTHHLPSARTCAAALPLRMRTQNSEG